MKKNAFTLIELLTVIVILAFVLLLSAPRILDLSNDVKDESMKSFGEIAVGNAKLYDSINEHFSAPTTVGECKLITFEELSITEDDSPYDTKIDLANSYVIVDATPNYYVTITTYVNEKGIKNLKNTKLDNDPVPVIRFEPDSSNRLDLPDVSSFSTTSGSETKLYLDTDGDKELDDSFCKLIEIRN